MNKENLAQELAKPEVFVGIDVHLKTYAVTVVEREKPLKRWSMPADNEQLVGKLLRDYPTYRIATAYEAGFSGFVLHRKLESAGIHNIVVHASSIAVSSRDRVKTDKRDSEKIALSLSHGMLKGIRIPTEEEELQRQLSRYRQQLMKMRTRVMIQIRRRLYHFGYNVAPARVLQRKHVKEILTVLADNELKFCIQSQYRFWEAVEVELREIDRQLHAQAAQCPLEVLYRTVPGIGRVSARILAAELRDMSQFSNEKALFRFVGLTPSEYSSGEHVRRGGISRQGNSVIRKILVEAAWVAIRKDGNLRKFYSQLAVRAGGNRAIVAVARKLVGRARAVFRTGELYRKEQVLAA